MWFYYRNTATGAAVQSSIELDQDGLVQITEEEHQLLVNPPPPDPAEQTQFDRDFARYQRRAAAKDQLLAKMAAENMARVRDGTWTVENLTDLMADPALKMVLDLIGTLSFELAVGALAGAANPLLTPAIKAGWSQDLQSHFYLEG